VGVPRLLDQYKQRRQAWLDQADELARLRDEVRLAAEREALDIVTAARRDVRRIVVEARRELLVLTAQLHASIEGADPASLQPGGSHASESAGFAAHLDAGRSIEALGATRDAVLDARREVRNVLDEARAEIEALAAEARTPLPEFPASLPPAPAEPPIPTLETILGSDPVVRTAAPALAEPPPIDLQAVASLPSERHHPAERAVPDGPVVIDLPPAPTSFTVARADAPPTTAQPITVLPQQLLEQESDAAAPAVKEPISFVLAPDADAILGGFHKRDSNETAALSLTTFGDTGPVHVSPQTPLLEDDDSGWRSKPMWAWVGMFGATGILLLAGAAWWAQAREARSTLLASITETNPTAVPGSSGKTGGGNSTAAAPTSVSAAPAPETPAGLAIEVRRTAWLRAIVDGKEDSRVYQAGETRNITGAHTVSLRAGDGGAVFVAVDGRPAEALGVAGIAVTRQYSIAGPAVVPAVATAPTPSSAANTATLVRPAPATPGNSAPTNSAPVPRPADVAAAPQPALQPAAPATPNEGTVGAAPTSGGRADLVSAGQQWLDAYQRRDRDGMAAAGTENVTVSDERTLTERFPAWQTGIRRELDQVELELTGDTALLTARMTERNGDNGTTTAQHVSRISQIWVRRNGRWRVADVRIMGEGRLNQIVR
jgi:ketosteroid isomerase-like protein